MARRAAEGAANRDRLDIRVRCRADGCCGSSGGGAIVGIRLGGEARAARSAAPGDCNGARAAGAAGQGRRRRLRSEEHTSELQSLMRNSTAGFCFKKKNKTI